MLRFCGHHGCGFINYASVLPGGVVLNASICLMATLLVNQFADVGLCRCFDPNCRQFMLLVFEIVINVKC